MGDRFSDPWTLAHLSHQANRLRIFKARILRRGRWVAAMNASDPCKGFQDRSSVPRSQRPFPFVRGTRRRRPDRVVGIVIVVDDHGTTCIFNPKQGDSVVNNGNGYLNPPAVRFDGGGGSGAAAQVQMTGALFAINDSKPGMVYTSGPSVTIDEHAGNNALCTYTDSRNITPSFHGTSSWTADELDDPLLGTYWRLKPTEEYEMPADGTLIFQLQGIQSSADAGSAQLSVWHFLQSYKIAPPVPQLAVTTKTVDPPIISKFTAQWSDDNDATKTARPASNPVTFNWTVWGADSVVFAVPGNDEDPGSLTILTPDLDPQGKTPLNLAPLASVWQTTIQLIPKVNGVKKPDLHDERNQSVGSHECRKAGGKTRRTEGKFTRIWMACQLSRDGNLSCHLSTTRIHGSIMD